MRISQNNYYPILFILISVIFTFTHPVYSQPSEEARAFYVPTFSFDPGGSENTIDLINRVIDDCTTYHYNQIYVQVRHRGDAHYYPNRDDSTYPNPEPRTQFYTLDPADLDVLQEIIDKAHNANPPIEVHAWLVMLNTWSRSSPPSSSSHIVNAHPDWITENSSGRTMTYADDGDLAVDPGIPAVQDQLFNVVMDIVRNYDLDGIHYDYIRHLGSDWGYDPVAKSKFLSETGWNIDSDTGLQSVYSLWRRQQINNIVKRIYDRVQLEKPWITVSAFCIGFDYGPFGVLQGHNWWTAHDAIDVVHGGAYTSNLTTLMQRYKERFQDANYGGRPYIVPLGAYVASGAQLVQQINTLRSATTFSPYPTIPPIGMNMFSYEDMNTGSDASFRATSTTGGPFSNIATIPKLPHKSYDTTGPNPPSSVSLNRPANYQIRISFNRPSLATDNEYPVQYRIYRDTTMNVTEIYDNLKMVFWDINTSRTSFTWDDVGLTPAFNYYYKVIAYDDWFNKAISPTVSTTALGANVPDIIIESRDSTGALTPVSQGYSESGGMNDSTVKSTAPGLSGQGTRYSTNVTINASVTFRPNVITSGNYNVYVTTPNASSVNAANSLYSLGYSGGTTNGTIALTSGNTGNQWKLVLGNIPFSTGTSGYITFSENSPQTDRFYSDAVKFEYVIPAQITTAWEIKPPVTVPTPPEPVEIIVDDTPGNLSELPSGLEFGQDFEAEQSNGNSNWQDVTGNLDKYYNETAEFWSTNDKPITRKAAWIIYLPKSGQYAIDGHVRGNPDFTQTAIYRFTDINNTLHSVTTSQRNNLPNDPGGYWSIDIDGVTDLNSFSFPAGSVYVTLHDDSGIGTGSVIADAIRFRYLGPPVTQITDWSLY